MGAYARSPREETAYADLDPLTGSRRQFHEHEITHAQREQGFDERKPLRADTGQHERQLRHGDDRQHCRFLAQQNDQVRQLRHDDDQHLRQLYAHDDLQPREAEALGGFYVTSRHRRKAGAECFREIRAAIEPQSDNVGRQRFKRKPERRPTVIQHEKLHEKRRSPEHFYVSAQESAYPFAAKYLQQRDGETDRHAHYYAADPHANSGGKPFGEGGQGVGQNRGVELNGHG